MSALCRRARCLLFALLVLIGPLLAGQWFMQAHALEHHAADGDDDGHAALCLHCLSFAAVQILPPPPQSSIWQSLAAVAGAPDDAVPVGLTFAPRLRPSIRAPPTRLPG